MAGLDNQTCFADALEYFNKNVGLRGPIWRVNALMVVNGVLMGVMVGIGAYGHRYRHHPLTRFLFQGATTLFLPIVSYVVSASGIGIGTSTKILYDATHGLIEGRCNTRIHIILIVVWTGLVLIIGINTTAIVAADAREGRSIPPNTVLLVQSIWTSYLAVYAGIMLFYFYFWWGSLIAIFILFGPFGLIFAKLLVKCYAWYTARQSFALGRNPRLIVGYMKQLHDESQRGGQHIPPPRLIVAGEHTVLVEKKPRGYSFKRTSNTNTCDDMYNNGALVTFDKVWQLDDTFLRSEALQLKDLCLSFALFKLLRCRFAKYTAVEAGFSKARNFLQHVLLEDNDGERVLAMIAHELSFLHDYYYSSLSISYSKSWLPILGIFISLLTIGYCLCATIILILLVTIVDMGKDDFTRGQINCSVYCGSFSDHNSSYGDGSGTWIYFGSLHFDIVPLYLLCALVVLAEVRDIASYICSNWTKVAVISHYVNHGRRRQPPAMPRYAGCVLKLKTKLMKNWEYKMNQCSVLVLHPRKTLVALLRRFVRLPDQKKNVPSAVKAAIIDALRSRINGAAVTSFQRSLLLQAGGNILWTFNEAKGTAETMLVCHIATTILEARSHPPQPISDHKTAANHLSQYCAYLVAYYPELLPEDDEWCKSLYKAVNKDAKRALLGGGFGVASTSKAECQQQLIKLLSAEGNHEVLKDGARLAARLAEGDEETVWKALTGFWSEMIMYVAPSENMDGHAKAIARGGELITLVWALVSHLGIVGRSDDITAAAADGDDGITVYHV